MRYFAILVLLITPAANAANWVQIAELDSKGSIVLIDTAGIARVGGLRKAWFKFEYTSDQPIPRGYNKSMPNAQFYRRELSLTYFNCAERTLATAQSIASNAEDKVVADFDTPQILLSYREVPPETIGERMLETVCDWEFLGDTPVQPVPPAKPQPGVPTPAELRERNQVEAELVRDPQQVGIARMKSPVNPDDYYPPGSIRRGEQGSPVVQACVGPSGKLLREPVVTDTSGFPDLDGAAIKVAKATRYAAGTVNGTPLPESCIKFRVKFGRNNY